MWCVKRPAMLEDVCTPLPEGVSAGPSHCVRMHPGLEAEPLTHSALCRNVVTEEIDAFDVTCECAICQRFPFKPLIQVRQELPVRQAQRGFRPHGALQSVPGTDGTEREPLHPPTEDQRTVQLCCLKKSPFVAEEGGLLVESEERLPLLPLLPRFTWRPLETTVTLQARSSTEAHEPRCSLLASVGKTCLPW